MRDWTKLTANASRARTMGVMMGDPLAEEGITRGGQLDADPSRDQLNL